MAKETKERIIEKQREKEQKKLLRSREVKKSIEELVSKEQFDLVFTKFGRDAYLKYVPKKNQAEEFKRLKKEGRYEEIYQKFGEKKYKKILNAAMFEEIKNEKGVGNAILWRIKQKMKQFAFSALITGSAFSVALPVEFGIVSSMNNKENAEVYHAEIEEYNHRNEEYAKQFGNVQMSKLQIMMKTMNDMWGSIKGYKTPEKNISGFLELDLATEEGYGVCRNMASDVAKRLNAIDSSFNARTMPVYMTHDGFYEIADIQRTILEDDSTVIDESKEESNSAEQFVEQNEEIITKLFGNHMVTFVDIPEDGVILVLDPTNPGIGVYKDGKVIMLNDNGKSQNYQYASKELSSIVVNRGIESVPDVIGDYVKSFQKSNLSLEELKEKYGLEAQNKALNEVKALSIALKIEKQSFDDRIKVDPNVVYSQTIGNEVPKIHLETEFNIPENNNDERQ